jgi:putative flippase GtrA
MHTFIKAQSVLIAGSAADFLVIVLMVLLFSCWYVTASAAGNIAGAIAQFILSRNWVFNTGKQKSAVPLQLIKFVFMQAGNIALATFGMYLFTQYTHLHYLLCKLIVSAFPGVSYTYLLSKKFVFA